MDVVGLLLRDAARRLVEKNCDYTVVHARPFRDYFKVDEAMLYVIRQSQREDGSYLLTTAAKMRKEVY